MNAIAPTSNRVPREVADAIRDDLLAVWPAGLEAAGGLNRR